MNLCLDASAVPTMRYIIFHKQIRWGVLKIYTNNDKHVTNHSTPTSLSALSVDHFWPVERGSPILPRYPIVPRPVKAA